VTAMWNVSLKALAVKFFACSPANSDYRARGGDVHRRKRLDCRETDAGTHKAPQIRAVVKVSRSGDVVAF